jgi:hypothetical protein
LEEEVEEGGSNGEIFLTAIIEKGGRFRKRRRRSAAEFIEDEEPTGDN